MLGKMSTQSNMDSTTYCRKSKLWSHVHRGNCRLQPLLGEFKPLASLDNVTRETTASGADRVMSLRVTSRENGPADVGFLKNRMGFCLPSVDLILRSQRLRAHVWVRSDCSPSRRSVDVKPIEDNLSNTISERSISNKGNKKASIMESLAHSKRIQKKLSVRDEEEISSLRLLLNDEDIVMRDVEGLAHILNIKMSNSGSFTGSTTVGHTERRMSQLRKIANNARKTSIAHEKWLDRKLSCYQESDARLTIDVRTQLDTSKTDERIKAFNKISLIEEKRKKIKIKSNHGLTIQNEQETDEEDQTYHIISRDISNKAEISYDVSSRSSSVRYL